MNALETRGLTKRFGGLVAVDSLDLVLPEGGLVGLIGPNGAGKTTVFNLVSGLYAPDAGSILVRDHDLAGHPPHEVARHGIARTFQNIRLFGSLTALDNVRVGAHMVCGGSYLSAILGGRQSRELDRRSREQAMQVLRDIGIERYANELASSLPYGVQRKLEIARALASSPSVLLLDEPACGMNPQETAELMDLVARLLEEWKLSILLIEHDMRFVMGICQTIYVLDYGKTIACGPPEAIRNDPAVIEAYLGDAVH
ncbi:MAG: ABC transporter ATP-binding protein [Armatimonadota bacterium]